MSDYPIKVEVLNRFRSAAESKKVLAALAAGDVDIVVGTHRLISKDVNFKNLGLAMVDEEQRFGVKHKERFKELFRLVDVLTLVSHAHSAHPLHGADGRARHEHHRDRAAQPHSGGNHHLRLRRARGERAIERELKRKGQVFFLHNRVATSNASPTKSARSVRPEPGWTSATARWRKA